MKVTLSVQERLVLGMILPKQSNFTTLKIITKLQDLIGFSEEEHKLLQFKYAGQTFINENGQEETVASGTIHWEDKVEEKDFKFGEKAADIIVDALKELDKSKHLGVQHMSLYEKFVECRSDM